MNAELIGWFLYPIQAILAMIALQGIAYRLIAVDFRIPLAKSKDFYAITRALNSGMEWHEVVQNHPLRGRPGWLERAISEHEAHDAAAVLEEENNRSQAYVGPLTLVATVATVFGLLGTVGGFIVSDRIDEASLALAFRNTFLGIVINLPPAIYLALTDTRRGRLQFQFETLLTALSSPSHFQACVKQETTLPATELATSGHDLNLAKLSKPSRSKAIAKTIANNRNDGPSVDEMQTGRDRLKAPPRFTEDDAVQALMNDLTTMNLAEGMS